MNGSQINKLILQALIDGDQYGLEIIKKIEDLTNGEMIIKQPSLYSSLSRMEKKGFVSSFWQDSDIGGRRHYYSLTNLGKKELAKFDTSPNDSVKEQETETPPVNDIKEPIQTPIIKNKLVFEQFDPDSSKNNKQSFTQQMREYIEPEEIELPSPTLKKDDFEDKSQIIETAKPNEKEVIEHKISKNDINYKDILGDLDADLPSNEVKIEQEPSSLRQEFTQNSIKIEPQTPPKTSVYSKQIAEILRSDKKSTQQSNQSSVNDLYSKQNKDLMAEISRRYNLGQNASKSKINETVRKIPANSVGYTHIKQDNITVKAYEKTAEADFNTKNFLDKNKLNLCRAGIMSIFFLIELVVSYFVLKNLNMIYKPHEFLFIFYGVLGLVYFGVMLMLSLKDLHKKTRIKDINWAMDLFYRFMLAIILLTFVISVCLCLGMTNLLDIEFFTLWYIPLLAIIDLLLSWFVGMIIYATKCFRV